MLLSPCEWGLETLSFRFLNPADSCFVPPDAFMETFRPTSAAAALAARFVSISGIPPAGLAGAFACDVVGDFAPDLACDVAPDFAAGFVSLFSAAFFFGAAAFDSS